MINVKDLPNPAIIKRLYELYHRGAEGNQNLLSSHWKDFSSKVKVSIDAKEDMVSFRGYGFGDLQASHITNRILKYLCNFSYFISFPYKSDLRFLIKRARPLLEKMDSFLSYDSFRQICSLSTIRRYLRLDRLEEFDVLIIGDGYGFLSALLKDIYPNSRITLIDIGKVLFFQAVNLQRVHPGSSHCLFDGTAPEHISDFLYIPAESIWKARPAKYKLIINIASMQEMTHEAIKGYFKFIRLNAREDNLFYCCNRTKKTLIGGEVIEFSNYPWQKEDRHFVDQVCPFCKYSFSIKFPFFHRFEGPIMHRLTNLKINEQG